MYYELPAEVITRISSSLYTAIEKINYEVPLLKNSIAKAVKKSQDDPDAYFSVNTSLRLRLAVLDMATMTLTLVGAKNEQEQNLYARLLCGQLYEFLEDVPKMFGKRYRKHFASVQRYIALDKEINAMMKPFNTTRTVHHYYLKEIRNNVASHRDDDGMKQAGIIDNIDSVFIATVFLEITGWFFSHFLPYELFMIKIAEKLGYGPDLDR